MFVHVLHKAQNKTISRHSRAVTATKYIKRSAPREICCFANLNLPGASGFCCLARKFRSLFTLRASEVFGNSTEILPTRFPKLYTLRNGGTLNQSDISRNVTL